MPETDPETSNWLMLIGGVMAFVTLFGAVVFGTLNQRSSSSSSHDDDEEYIRCPDCDEKIRESASRCKYCGAGI